MTAELDPVRPIADLPPVERVKVRWRWCGRLARWPLHADARAAAGPAATVYRCPFAKPKGNHWHASPMSPDDLVIIAHVARSPRVEGPVEDPRPGHVSEWVVTDGSSGRILHRCPPPPPSTSGSPAVPPIG